MVQQLTTATAETFPVPRRALAQPAHPKIKNNQMVCNMFRYYFFFQHNIINTTYFENWHLQQDDERLRHPRPGEATRQISSS
jgi:hypothetical protein